MFCPLYLLFPSVIFKSQVTLEDTSFGGGRGVTLGGSLLLGFVLTTVKSFRNFHVGAFLGGSLRLVLNQ